MDRMLLFLTTLLVYVGAVADPVVSSIWDLVIKDASGNDISLSTYKTNKVILIVNVASACGYTDQNYKELQVDFIMLLMKKTSFIDIYSTDFI